MARTLQQLKTNIERLIKQQGKDAPVSAFIFTKEDVYEMDSDGNPEQYPIEIAEKVLNELEENDWIYEQIFVIVEDLIKDVKIEQQNYGNTIM